MPIAIQCRRAPRSADFVIAENLDWLYTTFPPARQRWQQDMCPAHAMKKSRGENAVPVEITSLERRRSRASQSGKTSQVCVGRRFLCPARVREPRGTAFASGRLRVYGQTLAKHHTQTRSAAER